MREAEDTNAETGPRELLLLRAGGRAFAVYAEESGGVAEGAEPAPLPHAPPTVLGVVCVGGRMYTLLDPPALLAADGRAEAGAHEGAGARESTRPGSPRFAVTLRGDEQLALAADDVEGTVEVPAAALEPPDLHSAALRATLERGGERVQVLDPAGLFEAAMQGTERRRRRQ